MRILTELVGGVVLLLIFAYGVRETIKYIRERADDDTERLHRPKDAAGEAPTDEPG
jgi:hypothetical protein